MLPEMSRGRPSLRAFAEGGTPRDIQRLHELERLRRIHQMGGEAASARFRPAFTHPLLAAGPQAVEPMGLPPGDPYHIHLYYRLGCQQYR